MNARSDTPTPTTLTSEAGGVSIKIEQGVLCENNDECARSRYNTDMEATPIETYKPINPAITENNSINVYIKAEPDVDIDDRHPDEEAEENTSSGSQSLNGIPNIAPKIRLTPTSKLIASPNGSTGNKKRYVCTYENCTKSYGKSSHLRSHLTWHTGIKPFVCKDPSCGKGFTRSDELNRHVRTHTGEKPFECVQCTKKFSRSDHLTKHLVTHTKRLAAKDGFLAKKIKKEKNLIKQTPIVPAVANDNQDIKFENAYVPETEFNSANFSTNRLKATGEDNLRIKVEQPENKGDLISVAPEQHIKIDRCIMSPIPRSQTTVKEEFPLQIKPEPLEESNSNECPDMSNEPDDDEIMPEANLPPIIQNSTIVAKSEQPLLLKQSISHMTDTVYDPSRPFPCHHCTKNFKRLDDLNRHMRTHTGEKPFNCTECDKRFMRSDHLKKHLKTHARMNRNPNANEILCTNSLQTSASSNETYVS